MRFRSEGQYSDLCYYKHTACGVEGAMHMEEISKKMLDLHRKDIDSTYRELKWDPAVVKRLYCHQVGARPHTKMALLASQPLVNVPITYENFGNLTSATFPVNMSLNPPGKGDKVLLLGAGSGLSICQIGMQY